MPSYRRWIWWVCWAIVTMLRPLFCRLRVEGRENLLVTSGAVVASNHNFGPDFIFLAMCSPRELCFMAKAEAFSWNPLLTSILRAGGVFPVKRGKGDNVAIETAVDLAKEGNLIAMFPEGTRSKTGVLMRGKTGAARIALAAQVPIIPAVVLNSALVLPRKSWHRPLVTVRFGKPVIWNDSSQWDGERGEDEGEPARAYTELVMHEIAKLLPNELRGEYRQRVDSNEPMLTP